MSDEKQYDFQSRVQELRRLDKLARKILDVSDTADALEIKKAYWLLAMKFHPDKNPGDKETLRKFQNIKNAYDFLMNGENGNTMQGDFLELNEDSLSEPYDTSNSWGYFLWWRDKFF
jgi:hypothetical protein